MGIQSVDNTILIDKPRESWKWHSHMVSNNIEYLHQFAEKLGIGRHKFSNKKGKNRPHYDVPKWLLEKAIENGAVLVQSEEIIIFLKEHFE
ncbi:MAG: DUF4031 domain-containing protein [Nanoarchaeota archaeon]